MLRLGSVTTIPSSQTFPSMNLERVARCFPARPIAAFAHRSHSFRGQSVQWTPRELARIVSEHSHLSVCCPQMSRAARLVRGMWTLVNR